MNKTRAKRCVKQEPSEEDGSNQPLFRVYEGRRRNSMLLTCASPTKEGADRTPRSSGLQAASSCSPCKRKKKLEKGALHTTPKKSLTPYVIFVKKVVPAPSNRSAAQKRNRLEQPEREGARSHERTRKAVAGAFVRGEALLRSVCSEG